MPDKIHVHLEQEREWDDKALAYIVTDSVYVNIGGLGLHISPAEIHDWRRAGGDADFAKWLALQNETEGDGGEGEG